MELYRQAAEAGSERGLLLLAGCLLSGVGTQAAPEQAVRCYEKGAEAGSAQAMCNLGWCYETGNGVEQSWEQAVLWYRCV